MCRGVGLKHPFDRAEIKDGVPHTNTGMSGTAKTIIPEYYVTNDITLGSGCIRKRFDKNGKLMKTYKFEIIDEENNIGQWIEQKL